MLLVAAMDEGPLLAQSIYDLEPQITTPQLTDDLVMLSYEMLKYIVPIYLNGEAKAAPQATVTLANHKEPTYSRKLTKEDGILDWNKPADQLEREIRAFVDWPKSRTTLAGKDVIITKAYAVPINHPAVKPGSIKAIKDAGIITAECGRGHLCIERLKPAGKKEMSAKEFLAGYGAALGR